YGVAGRSRALLGEHRGRPRRSRHQRAGRPHERAAVHVPVGHHRPGRRSTTMSPSRRAGPPGGPGMPDDAALPDDPDGSAPPPPEPDDLDRLVDRLAAEHPSEAAEATGTDPGGAGGVDRKSTR